MSLTESQRAFVDQHPQAAFITSGPDSVPRAVRVGIAFVDGKLWSSGTPARVRNKRLRQDPRCTIFVFDAGWKWLTIEATVEILDGPEAPEQNLRLFRQMQNRPTGPLRWFDGEYGDDEFLRLMAEEKRLIYEFDVTRAYGMVE